MIQEINIEDYGSYKNFIWSKDIKGAQFKKVNIIYGRNYSGKTTLSRIFNTFENRKSHDDYPYGSYEVKLNDATTFKSSEIDKFPDTFEVRVFNSDFIKSNLSWLYNDDGSIEPFTVLGEKNVNLRKDIKVREDKLGSEEMRSGLLWELKALEIAKNRESKDYTKKCRVVTDLLTDMATTIRKNQNKYNRSPYDRRHLEVDIRKITSYVEMSQSEYKLAISQLDEKQLPNISYAALPFESFKQTITEATELLIRQVKISNPIQELINDELLNSWVREGVNLHEGDNTLCKFCKNPIKELTWLRLKQHFNTESEELQRSLTLYKKEFAVIKDKVEKHLAFSKKDVYLAYYDEYLSVYEGWDSVKDAFIKMTDNLITALDKKSKNVTDTVNFEFDFSLLEKLERSSKDISILVTKHNDKSKSLKDDKNKLHTKILMSDIIKFLRESKMDKLNADIEEAKTLRDNSVTNWGNMKRDIDKIKEEITDLKNQEKDETKGAERVNEYLKKYFGSDEILLTPIVDGGITKYQITRNGLIAKNLSDGECSLISFCYFIARTDDLLKEEKKDVNQAEGEYIEDVKKPIIYIDDPISSLDNNHVFFVFSIIEEKIASSKKLHQLFISTHNLDFLKYLRRLSGSDDLTEYFMIEKHRKQTETKSCICVMETHLREYVTEFNYLFGQMYELYKEVRGDRGMKLTNSYNQFYSLPNNIRKFLELYLFYKFPYKASLSDKLKLMFSDNVPTMVNRIVNEFSHLSYIERAWKPFDVPELEDCVKIIFDRIQEIDKQQFDVLVEEFSSRKSTA